MTKRPIEQESDMMPEASLLGIDSSKTVRLEGAKQSIQGEDGPPDSEDIGSDSGGSDLDSSVEDLSSDSDNVGIDPSPADGDKTVQDAEKSGTIDENTWVVVHPPEPAIDMKSKFTVTNTGFCNVPKSKNPMDFFSLFLSEELFLKMVQNTNEYARNMFEKDPKHEISKLWCEVKLDEMKKFWGILINMGLSQRSSYRDYWSTHPVLSFPFFSRVMALDRFEAILSMISLTSPSSETSSNPDPLVEVDYLLTSLNSAFKHYYVPDQEIRLDESLIYTSKQSHYTIQYLNKKYLVQGGVQKFEICDPSSEYIIHIGLRNCRSGIKGKTGHSKDVVLGLLKEANLTNKGYHLFIRKAYMGLKLSQQLLSANTFVTGPLDLKQYKDFPSTITRCQLKPEATLYARSGDHLLIKYNNQKPVCLTTGGWAENQSTENAKCQQRVKPILVRRYLRYISGKDKSYLHVTSTVDIDSCWKKIAFNLVDLALFNAYILFKSQKDVKPKYCRQTFLENIVQKLASLSHVVTHPGISLGFVPNPAVVNWPRCPSTTFNSSGNPSTTFNSSGNPSTVVISTRNPSTTVNSTRNPSTAVNSTRNPSEAVNSSKSSSKVVKDLGGGHKLTRVHVSTIQICKVCRREGKSVKFICPVCNVYIHDRCFAQLQHNLNPQKAINHSTTVPMLFGNVGSCISVKSSGIFEVTDIKVESDSDD